MLHSAEYIMSSFIRYCVISISVLLLSSMFAYSEVAGIEFKATFRNFNIEQYNLHLDPNASCFMHFSTDSGHCAVDMREFIKPDMKIPLKPNIMLRTYCNGFVEETQNVSISDVSDGTIYDCFNVYGSPLPTNADFVFGYDSPLGFMQYSRISRLISLKSNTMHFVNLTISVSDNEFSPSIIPENVLSNIEIAYPTNSFVNNYPTSRVVRIIAPNNPYYEEYKEYLRITGSGMIPDGYSHPDWDAVSESVEVEPGVLLAMPDKNNTFQINSNQLKYDNDDDGIPTVVEFLNTFTNPFSDDTDGDGLKDYPEVFGTNMILKLSTGHRAISVRTCSIWPDTDNDGISDGDELFGRHPYEGSGTNRFYATNPCSADSDDDGLPDKEDPFPLTPCFSQNSTNISQEWVDYWNNIANIAGVSLNELGDQNADSDGDGVDNLTEMLNKTCPVFGNGFHKVVFEPAELDLGLINSVTTATFSATFFAPVTITGAVYISQLDWNPEIKMDGLSVFWPSFIPRIQESSVVTFTSSLFDKKDFSLTVDPEKMRNGVTQEWIRVIDQFGEYNEALKVTCCKKDGYCNLAPSIPELIAPLNDTILMVTNDYLSADFTNTFDFVWGESIDPEGENVNYILKLYYDNYDCLSITNDGLSCSLPISEYFTDWGYYYWRVYAYDTYGNVRASNMRSFYVWIPRDDDGDGVDDNIELREGSDPSDANSIPLTILSDETLPPGYLERDYFLRLKAKGGEKLPYYWFFASGGNVPPGIELTVDGVLRGTPTQVGSYSFNILVFDGKKYCVKPFNLTVNPKRTGLGVKAGRGEL